MNNSVIEMNSLHSRIVSFMDLLSSGPTPLGGRFCYSPAGLAAGVQSEHGCAANRRTIENCKRCFASSRDKVALWRHAREAHGDDPRLLCPVAGCGRRFSSVFASMAHRSHHSTCGQVTQTCELCGRMSPDRPAYERHVAKEHPDARDALCGACGLYMGDEQSLREHANATHGVQIRPELMRVARGSASDGGPERVKRARHSRYASYTTCGKRHYGGNRW